MNECKKLGRWLAVILATTIVHIGSAQAQIPVVLQVINTITPPWDLEFTPNGDHAVIRLGIDPLAGIYIVKLNPLLKVYPFGTTSAPLAVNAVELTNTHAVVLGGPGAEAIKFFDLTTSPPTLYTDWALGSTPPHDIDITPDGTKAVIRETGPPGIVAVFDLSGGYPVALGGQIVGAPPVSVQSVAVSNTRAVVLGGAGADAVQILDITAPLVPLLGSYSLSTAPRGVAITPDGQWAIVRAGAGADAITVYELSTGALDATIASPSTPVALYPVVATESCAVVLGGTSMSPRAVDFLCFWTPAVITASFGLSSEPRGIAISPDLSAFGYRAAVRAGAGADATTFYDMSVVPQVAVGPPFSSTSTPTAAVPVRMTDTRAVVLGVGGSPRAVQIFDVSTPAPSLMASYSESTTPHDVAVTPSGTKAVVRLGAPSATGLTVYDMPTGSKGPSSPTSSVPANLNSVEVSDYHYIYFNSVDILSFDCDCPNQGDVSPPPLGDGVINVLDVIELIDHVFRSGPALLQDSQCPALRGDWNCDGVVNVLDVVGSIDYVFRSSGNDPCDPCSCSPYPTTCPSWP